MALVHSALTGSIPTCDAFASRLTGCQYREEGSRELWAEMKAAGFVAVFGASDDLMELRGAVDEEVGCYNGTTVFLTPSGLLELCEDRCPHFRRTAREAVGLSAIWAGEGEPAWTYKTAIPHSTFDVMEDDELYCRGIVFALADAKPTPANSVGIAAGDEPKVQTTEDNGR